MAFKKNKKNEKESTIENYYDLKTDKVDELVAALKDEPQPEDKDISLNIDECTGIKEDEQESGKKRKNNKEFDPYKVDKLAGIPAWIKALFIKFWFAGCVCYFVMMGIGFKDIDAIFLTGVVLGIIVDVLVNPCFRYMESDKKEYNVFMMFPFPFKQFWTFFTNIIYYVVVLLCVNYCYLGINQLCNLIAGTELRYYVAVEPLLFGVLATIVDMAFIGIKDGIVYGVKKAKRKKQLEAEGIAADVDAAFEVTTPNAQSGAEQKDAAGNLSTTANNATAGNAAADGNSAAQPQTNENGEIDEVEKLRRLAESQNQTAESDAKKKHKKK